jgi:CheY-like chemotaxis protein
MTDHVTETSELKKDGPLALVIEDDGRLADLFAHALVDVGYKVEMAANGRAAQTALQTMQPKLILLDLHLPFVPGEQLLAEIQQDERLRETVVILATADALLAEELQKSVSLVLLKPISFVQLRDLAARLLSLSRITTS